MESIKEFPRGILDQVISKEPATAGNQRAPGPGLMLPDSKMVKQRATSSTSRDQERFKLQAPGVKLSNQPVQASSDKRQAPGSKLQASSHKLQAQ
jgi:hypothetical protein